MIIKVISWNRRSLNLEKLKEILQSNPDIICLQEIWNPEKSILDLLSSYSVHHLIRTDERGDSTLLAWKEGLTEVTRDSIQLNKDTQLIKCSLAGNRSISDTLAFTRVPHCHKDICTIYYIFPCVNYDIRQPFKVSGRPLSGDLTMFTSQNEYLKTSYLYPTLKLIDPQNIVDKNKVHQDQGQLIEFKLDIEANCVVSSLFFFIQYRNKNTDITKSIKHTSPMINIERITLEIKNNVRYTVKPEDIYVYNSVRLSHGDKMFTDLIDNLGLSSSYDIDPNTNTIPPAGNSKWYFFAIPLFANNYIPFNVLTNNTTQYLVKVYLDAGQFILPTSHTTSYTDLAINDCKLVASQLIISPRHFDDIVKNPVLEYRINDTQNSFKQAMETSSLLIHNRQSIKVTARSGGTSLFLIGLRERNNPLTFATFIPINNISLKRKDGSMVKNQLFNTDILRNLNTFDNDIGEFFRVKNLVAFSFDSMIDKMIVMNHHGAFEVMEDEFNIEFEVIEKTMISSNKNYELVVQIYMPKLLRLFKTSQDVDIVY